MWLISGRATMGGRFTSLLDGLIMTSALFVMSWAVTLRTVWEAGADSLLAFVVSLAYPVGDLVLATMAFLVAARTRRGTRTVVALLIAGLLGMAAADTLFALHSADGTYVSGVALLTGFSLILARQLLTLVRNSTLTEQLRHQAYRDPLTGLGNRALCTDRLEDVLATRVRAKVSPTVLHLDLDDFKLINDTLGHDAGDDLLRFVADRLRDCFPDADTIARLGGDEFAVPASARRHRTAARPARRTCARTSTWRCTRPRHAARTRTPSSSRPCGRRSTPR